jgi:hypothetical protein
VVVSGSGPGERTIAFEQGGPLVFRARVGRGEGFRVTAQSTRYKLLVFNGRGPFDAPVALPAPGPGPVELDVASDGEWSLSIEQPVASADDVRIPGTVSGEGAAVVPVRVAGSPPVRLIATHEGEGPFEARIVPYEEYAPGFELLAGSGQVERRVALTQPLQGSFLVTVVADGPWTLRFLDR